MKEDTDILHKLEEGLMTESMDSLTKEYEDIKAALIDLKSEMINYLNAKNKKLEVGHFIKLFIEAVEIKQIEFANYLGLTSESLTELLTGQSQLNIELAFILEMLTNINAELWIGVQSHNEQMSEGSQEDKV